MAALRALFPDVEVAVVARFAAQAEFADVARCRQGVEHEPRLALVEQLAAWSGGVLHTPFDGLPVAHPGGIDVVYDTIARPETLEVGVRVLAERGTLVQSGVSTPGRWEWTPIYFKELTIAGSNAFGMEEIDGVRKHAIAHYLDMAAAGTRRPHRHAHAPVPARRVVGRPAGHRPPGRERRHQGRFRAVCTRGR